MFALRGMPEVTEFTNIWNGEGMKRNLIVWSILLVMFLILGDMITLAQSQQGSGDAMKTQMDCIMARDRKTWDLMWQATKQGDARKLDGFRQSGKAIMLPRGTSCVVLREVDKDYVAVTVSGQQGEWVTIKKVFVGFQ